MKFSRHIAGALIATLMVACGSVATTTTTSTTVPPTTSTTVPATTTTTVPPFEVDGASAELTDLVESFYEYSASRTTEVPPLPFPVASLTPVERDTPRHGVASTGAFREQTVATVEIGDDLILAVDDGSGWRIVGGSWPDLDLQYFGDFPRLVAVIGSDARPGENQDRSRGDSIHVVALDGKGGGGVVGIPRDAYVPIPGVGQNRVSAALSLGGPDAIFEAVGHIAGLPLEGYALTGFEGFRAMVGEVLGGIEVDVPFAINDKWAKAYFEAGRQMLNGKKALAFARPRKTVPGGDFARSELQGMLLIGAAEAVEAQGFGVIPKLMEGSDPWLTTSLSPEQLLTFSAAVVTADLDNMANVVVPGRGGRAGSASVVFLSDSGQAIWDDLADGRLDD